jgi:putative flippase GtrA
LENFPFIAGKRFICCRFQLTVTEVDDVTRSLNSMLSNGVAFIFSSMVAYLINVFLVFIPGRHNKFVEIGLFYLVSGVSVIIGTSTMGFLIRHYGIQTTYAFAANIVSAVMINYGMRKFYIFKG